MRARSESLVEAKEAALEVLRHNAHGPCQGLPRTAGWGYPEPYTRDMMIAVPRGFSSAETARSWTPCDGRSSPWPRTSRGAGTSPRSPRSR